MQAVQRIFALAHRHIWQALPRSIRRRALITLASRMAPRPDPKPDADGPIIIAGFLTAATGLGASARLSYEALHASGQPVMGIDLSAAFRQGSGDIAFPFRDGSRHDGSGTLLLHVNAPFVPLALWHIGRHVVRNKLIVGVWAWELPDVPPEWRAGVPLVHRVVVPSIFPGDAIRAIAPQTEIDVLPYPVAAGMERNAAPPEPAQNPFTVLVVFNMASGFERKNPLAAIEAFNQAFGADPTARLIIKMLNAASNVVGADRLRRLAASNASIVIDERRLSPAEMSVMYAQAHVVLSLHRSEGFGLVIAEGMLAGRPVIATDWSGSIDFIGPETGMPVPYRLVAAIDPDGEYHRPNSVWADADTAEAAKGLRALRDDAELRRRLGEAARCQALEHFAPERYASALLKRVLR